jgi:hypothetical protein
MAVPKRKPRSRRRRQPPRRQDVIGIDLTLCPQPWLPEASNTVTFTARIYKCVPGQGWVYPGPARVITFTLHDVSTEKGICLNKGRSSNPDLWFPRQAGFRVSDDQTVDVLCEPQILAAPNPAHKHYRKARTRQAVTEATVTVRSEDFGSWGWIEATAAGCVQIPPREAGAAVACPAGQCCQGSNRVKLPRDDNGNNIADVAPQDDGGAAADTDGDTVPPGDGEDGDGLSNYEEYRGFMVLNGAVEAHIRTNITDKDLFIYDDAGAGIGHYGISGFTIHFVRRDHLGGGSRRVINFNRGFATQGVQHGLRLYHDNLGGDLGYCFGTGPGPPKTATRVVVDPAAHVGTPYDIANTRAHELGHGTNVRHHGEDDVFDDPVSGRRRINPRGGLTSGNFTCLMRYDNYARYWRWSAQRDYRYPRPEAPGVTFCASKLGTGPNRRPNNRNNRATLGNCRRQLRVNDH